MLCADNEHNIKFEFYKYILKARRAYQELIICVYVIREVFIKMIKEGFRKNDDFEKGKKKKKREGKRKKNEILKTILLNVARFDSKTEITKMIKIISMKSKFKVKNKGRKFKKNKFQKFLSFFNMYISLYLIDNAMKYVIIMNSNILMRELKYKYVRKTLKYCD